MSILYVCIISALISVFYSLMRFTSNDTNSISPKNASTVSGKDLVIIFTTSYTVALPSSYVYSIFLIKKFTDF